MKFLGELSLSFPPLKTDFCCMEIFPLIYHARWIEVATRMGEVVRMFNGGTGEWCLASQEEMRIAEVVISKNDMPNFYWD